MLLNIYQFVAWNKMKNPKYHVVGMISESDRKS
jgi:hypothetical protein